MDGRSSGLGGVPAVASDGTSSTNTPGKDILPEKQSAVDGAPRQAQDADGSLEDGASVDFSESSVGLGMRKDLQKCATFPSSVAEVAREGSCCDADGAAKDAHTYQRSVSLPPPVKLISAMKGSRQKNGVPSPTENRHIKWAEDVYDPPVTSVSHSVNNSYKRQPNPRKKDKSKQKQKQKGRSKKKTKNANQNPAVTQTPGLEELGTSIIREAPADPGKHETEALDYGISSQDAKCGSSFLLETVAKMHFSTAEAS
uniref:Uncharacterized protein n=1 Tax=Avena sativa TaxID=4498 RepID=A0ACD5ZNP6_AVESA